MGKNQDSCFIIQKWRSNVTPRRASSSYRLHVHTFSHACTRIKGVPYESATPNFERKTWEIKNVLVAALIFKKSWSLWTKAWLASSLLEQTLKNTFGEDPSNRFAIFVQTPTTQPKETGGQTWSKASTQSEGELHCRMEPVFVLLKKKKKKKKFEGYPCLTMPANISWFFQPIPVFVDNLAQNSTRFSLSNEPFLLINHVFSFFCVHANNILSTPLYLQNHYAKNLWACFSFFPKQQATLCFHKDFWEINVLIQNKNQIGVCSNKQVLENSSDILTLKKTWKTTRTPWDNFKAEFWLHE